MMLYDWSDRLRASTGAIIALGLKDNQVARMPGRALSE